MENRKIEALLAEIGELLELKGEGPFKVRAYEGAARAIGSLQEDVAVLVREKRLQKVPGIGKSMQAKLEELIETGKIGYLEQLREELPAGLPEVLKVPGMGPKKTRLVWEQLGVNSLEALEAACREGRVASLKGSARRPRRRSSAGSRTWR